MGDLRMTNNQDDWMSLALKREIEIDRLRLLNAELLAALEETLTAFDQRSRGGRIGQEQAVFQRARAAITKARKGGET